MSGARGNGRQREGRDGRENRQRDGQQQRGGQRRRTNDTRQNFRKDRGQLQQQDDKRERQPFVPWLGEERPSKGPIMDLEKYKDQKISVEFSGGRRIEGVLTGYDQLMNMVLEDVVEILDDGKTRKLGLLVARGGPIIQTIYPVEGSAVIENPF